MQMMLCSITDLPVLLVCHSKKKKKHEQKLQTPIPISPRRHSWTQDAGKN